MACVSSLRHSMGCRWATSSRGSSTLLATIARQAINRIRLIGLNECKRGATLPAAATRWLISLFVVRSATDA